ncbi:MAG: TraR/DksA C4-type zinc finger protein [Planctomycetes bacterium]|nr:TraR/DksA C4-type zinc finger protein [Planctomycetota bacterium]
MAGKSGAGKSGSSKKSGKKAASASSKKPAVTRTASKVSGKGVLIRLKRSGPAPAASPEERVKLRHVNATEKSLGENPITLHHRKPTKKEADEFRQLLTVRRAQLQGDVNDLENEAFSDETQHVSSNHLADSSFEQYEQEFNLSMIENETEELKEISRALEKIDGGKFGECEACGIDISIERLRVMPYTRICIHCRSKYEEEGGGEQYGVHPERRV